MICSSSLLSSGTVQPHVIVTRSGTSSASMSGQMRSGPLLSFTCSRMEKRRAIPLSRSCAEMMSSMLPSSVPRVRPLKANR